MRMTARTIARATGGRLRSGRADRVCRRISTDTRSIRRGDWFLALRGESFDGHRFVAQALERGARGLILEDDFDCSKAIPLVQVEDSLQAYGDITGAWLRRLRTPVIAITGSSGKTTTKDMLGAIMRRSGPTLVTEGNLNNRIGVPHMLQNLTEKHRLAVLEIGMNMPGEIDALGEILRPRIGVITNVGITHAGMFRNGARGVLRAKAELLDHVRETVVLNADCPNTPSLRQRAKRRGLRIVTFSAEGRARADVRVIRAEPLEPIGHLVMLATPKGGVDVPLRIFGHHNIANLAAATAAALTAGAKAEDIPRALRGFETTGMRSQIRRIGDVTVIVDCYNASPQSVGEALRSMAAMKVEGRRIAVLGDMFELGRQETAEHRRVGRMVAECGIDRLFTFGKASRDIGKAAKIPTRHFSEAQAVARHLSRTTRAGDAVLVKGSRGMAMERILEAWEAMK